MESPGSQMDHCPFLFLSFPGVQETGLGMRNQGNWEPQSQIKLPVWARANGLQLSLKVASSKKKKNRPSLQARLGIRAPKSLNAGQAQDKGGVFLLPWESSQVSLG